MINTLTKEGIFVIHALSGYEYHEKRVIELFKSHNLHFEFVTDGDPSLFNKDICAKYFTADIASKLTKGVLSCTLNHIYAYERIVSRKIEYAVIFENDPFLVKNFTQKLKRYFSEIENLQPGFIISLENTTLKFPSFWQTKRGKLLYPAQSGRMAGAYLIDLAGATKILDDLNQHKCHTVIDWYHNSLIKRGVLRMYWAHPPLAEQGSHNGRMHAGISSKPGTAMRRISWVLQKYFKLSFRRLFRERRVL